MGISLKIKVLSLPVSTICAVRIQRARIHRPMDLVQEGLGGLFTNVYKRL